MWDTITAQSASGWLPAEHVTSVASSGCREIVKKPMPRRLLAAVSPRATPPGRRIIVSIPNVAHDTKLALRWIILVWQIAVAQRKSRHPAFR
jgi:hypothetical protein